MPQIQLDSLTTFENALASHARIVLFKHSPICPTSSRALAEWDMPTQLKIIELPSFTKYDLTLALRDLPMGGDIEASDADGSFTLTFTVKNALNQDYYHPNVRVTGPRSYLQPGRQFVMRGMWKF